MIRCLLRSQLFAQVPVADELVAQYQQSYSDLLDPEYPPDLAMIRRYYDHLQPGRTCGLDAEGVLVYLTGSRRQYVHDFPQALVRFFSGLQISRFVLCDFLNTDLSSYPFSSFAFRNRFRSLTGAQKPVGGLLLDAADLQGLLPLFFRPRRWDIPLWLLCSADDLPIGFHYCDDGNLHYHCRSSDEAFLQTAAARAGLVVGGHELCAAYSVVALPAVESRD